MLLFRNYPFPGRRFVLVPTTLLNLVSTSLLSLGTQSFVQADGVIGGAGALALTFPDGGGPLTSPAIATDRRYFRGRNATRKPIPSESSKKSVYDENSHIMTTSEQVLDETETSFRPKAGDLIRVFNAPPIPDHTFCKVLRQLEVEEVERLMEQQGGSSNFADEPLFEIRDPAGAHWFVKGSRMKPRIDFVPTEDWQAVPEDAFLPVGLEIRMNLDGGKFARLMPGGTGVGAASIGGGQGGRGSSPAQAGNHLEHGEGPLSAAGGVRQEHGGGEQGAAEDKWANHQLAVIPGDDQHQLAVREQSTGGSPGAGGYEM